MTEGEAGLWRKLAVRERNPAKAVVRDQAGGR